MSNQSLLTLATQQITELLSDSELSKNQRLRALEVAAKLLSLRGSDALRIEGNEAAELLRTLGFGEQ